MFDLWRKHGARWIWSLIVLGLTLGNGPGNSSVANAQDASDESADPVRETASDRAREPVALEEMVVSADRITPVSGASSAVVTADEMRERQAKDVAEVLKTAVPGVTGKRAGGMNLDPIVRGLREDRVSVMTNGTKIWGAGPFRMDPPTSLLETAELEAIEVIKGPYSVTRGPSGVGGTINLVTKKPELSPQWYARGSLGGVYVSNFDGYAGQATVSAGGPSVAFRLSAGYRDYQDYDAGNGERVQSGFQSQAISGAMLWQPHRKHRFHLSFGRESDRDARFATLPLNLEEDDAYLGSVTYTIADPFPSVESLEFTGYYNYVHHRMKNEHKPSRLRAGGHAQPETPGGQVSGGHGGHTTGGQGGHTAGGHPVTRIVFPLDARTFGGRAQANVLPGFGGRLSVGGDLYRVEREGTNHVTFLSGGGVPPGTTRFFDIWPETHIVDGGLFGECAYRIAPKWRLVVGARVDFVDAGANPSLDEREQYRYYNHRRAAGADGHDVPMPGSGHQHGTGGNRHGQPMGGAHDERGPITPCTRAGGGHGPGDRMCSGPRDGGAGARKDVDEFETNVSANGRLIYSPRSSLDLFVGLGRGARTPDATERYFVLGPGPGGFYVGNPRLDSEESLEVDVGANGRWGRLRFDGSFFYNRIDDYILQYVVDDRFACPHGPCNLRGFRNIDHASLLGVDVGVRYALRDDLSLHGSFAYVRGENEDDDVPLPEMPPLEGRLGFRYDLFDRGMWFTPTLRLVQSQHRIDTAFGENVTDSFATVDLAAGWRFLGRHEVTVSVENLFDKHYHEHVTREDPFDGREIAEPGRVVTVGWRTTF